MPPGKQRTGFIALPIDTEAKVGGAAQVALSPDRHFNGAGWNTATRSASSPKLNQRLCYPSSLRLSKHARYIGATRRIREQTVL
jgi:hypothetical protein